MRRRRPSRPPAVEGDEASGAPSPWAFAIIGAAVAAVIALLALGAPP